MLASLPTPYDRSAIALAAGGDARVLSPNGTTFVSAGDEGEEEEDMEDVNKRLTFSRVKARPPSQGGLLGGTTVKRGRKREQETDDVDNFEGGNDEEPEMGEGGGKGKRQRVSFGSNQTKLYNPQEVVSTKKRKQVGREEGEVKVLKKQNQVPGDMEEEEEMEGAQEQKGRTTTNTTNTTTTTTSPKGKGVSQIGRGTKRSADASTVGDSLMSPPSSSNKRSRPPPRPKSIHATLRRPSTGEGEEQGEDEEEFYLPRGYIMSPNVASPRVINPLLSNIGEGGLLGSPQVWARARPMKKEGGLDPRDTMVVSLLTNDETVVAAEGGVKGRAGMWGRERREVVEGRVERIIKGGNKKKVEGGVLGGGTKLVSPPPAKHHNHQQQKQQQVPPLTSAPPLVAPSSGLAPSFSFGGSVPSQQAAPQPSQQQQQPQQGFGGGILGGPSVSAGAAMGHVGGTQGGGGAGFGNKSSLQKSTRKTRRGRGRR